MAKFSERLGIAAPRQIQVGEMDDHLRNALWNWVHRALEGTGSYYWWTAARNGIWDEVLHLCIDDVPHNHAEVREELKDWFQDATWAQAYELIEFMLPRVNRWRDGDSRRDLVDDLNGVLAREMSGYRLVRGELVPIVDPVEVSEVERATKATAGYEGVAQHIRAALSLLSKKPEPDYRNSIKESISAIEAAVKALTGERSGGIDKALAILEKSGRLHSALKTAFSKLYAYTSDEDGIRHAMIDDPHTTFAEAKFMLVACSAFANLIIESAVQSN